LAAALNLRSQGEAIALVGQSPKRRVMGTAIAAEVILAKKQRNCA